MSESLDQAFRRGKAAGYSVGLVDGWDGCMRHVKAAFDAAIAVALKEPKAIARHREAAGLKQHRRETNVF